MKTLIFCLFTTLISNLCLATTWTVDDDGLDYPGADFSSIQDAVDAALSGDVINVYPGTYTSNEPSVVTIPGNVQMTLTSVCGPDATIIDGENIRQCVFVLSGSTPSTVIEGFSITNGTGFSGAGVFCQGNPTIRGCNIFNNHVSSAGGGIICLNAQIIDCRITGNTASYGAGIQIQQGTDAVVKDCTIVGNYAGAVGGGISVFSDVAISNCMISENSAQDDGGGIYVWGGHDSTISDCTITSNNANVGGGLWCAEFTTPDVISTLICNNTVDQTSGAWNDFGGNNVSATCPIGACCYDGTCEMLFPIDCASIENAIWLGTGSSCDECSMEVTGACCYISDCQYICNVMSEEDCLSIWPSVFEANATCECVDCSSPPESFGACCYEGAGGLICESSDQKTCFMLNGNWYQGSSCECVPCVEETGACCYQDNCESACNVMTESDCELIYNGTYFPNNSTCDTVSCPPSSEETGACCYEGAAGLICEELDGGWCAELNGTWFPGIACECIDCDTTIPTGACCYLDDLGYMTCIEISESQCNKQLEFSYAGDYTTCGNTLCCSPIGACCITDRCVLTSQIQCDFASGVYHGDGITCAVIECLYCSSDINGDGVVNIDDLLVLIGAWGMCP